MKSFWGLIPRYFKTGKKRVIFAATGIILSIALIVSLGTISQAIKEALHQKMLDDSGGNHDIYVGTIGYVDFDRVKSEPTVKELTTVHPIATYDIPNTKNRLQISSFKQNAKDILNLNLLEGRYPDKDNEIALERWILELLPNKYNVGDTITIPYTLNYRGRGGEVFKEEGEADFLLTGIYTFTYRDWFFPKEGTGYITPEFGEKLLSEKGISIQSVEADGYVMINSGYSVEEAVKLLTKSRYLTAGFFPNEKKLELQAEYEKYDGIIIVLAVIMVIIASVIIYNVFSVSISERISEFGMLRATGCSKGKLRALIIFEGMIIAAVCIPIGILLGNFLTRFIIKMTTGIENLSGVTGISPTIIIIAIVIGVLIALIGTIFPAQKVAALSPLAAIRGNEIQVCEGNNGVKIDSKGMKKLTFDARFAIVNVVRNKKRFISTCLSLIITINMFILVSFIIGSTNPEAIFKEGFKVDFKISTDSGFSEDIIKSVEGFEVTKKLMRKHTTMDIDKEQFTTEGLEKYKSVAESSTYTSNCLFQDRYYIETNVFGYSDEQLEALKEYILDGDININDMKDSDSAILIQNIEGLNYSQLSVGDEVQPSLNKYDDDGKYVGCSFPKVSINAVVSEEAIENIPLMTDRSYMQSTVLIMPEETLHKKMNLTTYQYWEGNVKDGYDYSEVEKNLRTIVESNKGSTFLSYREEIEKVKLNNAQIIFAMYSIVIVIAIVSLINLINIMKMSVIIRKKEFGILRSMGMDRSKVKGIVKWEGIFYGLFSSIVSIIL
ncbi:MAG: ABC transporter permease, partial [Clostridium sp.]